MGIKQQEHFKRKETLSGSNIDMKFSEMETEEYLSSLWMKSINDLSKCSLGGVMRAHTTLEWTEEPK